MTTARAAPRAISSGATPRPRHGKALSALSPGNSPWPGQPPAQAPGVPKALYHNHRKLPLARESPRPVAGRHARRACPLPSRQGLQDRPPSVLLTEEPLQRA
jgi:hypothetical protein